MIESDHVVRVRERVEGSLRAKQRLLEDGRPEAVARAADMLVACFRGGGQLLLFGNGGSAADAQHIAAEFVGRYLRDRPALPALALATNTSATTAIANDYGFAEVFARQVEAFGRPGDVALGISTSGDSENVVRALEVARRDGLGTIALTGVVGSRTEAVAELCLAVPVAETPHIQECHILLGHIVCEIVERELFPDAR